jgi:putative ABC transport system permease protein
MKSLSKSLVADLRSACRAALANRQATLVAIVTGALIVAAVGTVFALVDSVILSPLPYPAPDRLVTIDLRSALGAWNTVLLSDAKVIRQSVTSLEASVLYRVGITASVTNGTSRALTVQDVRTTPELFSFLDLSMSLGRPLVDSDAVAGSPDVAVISHDLWRSLYGSTDDVIGATLRDGSESVVVVGVLAPGTNIPFLPDGAPTLLRPLREGQHDQLGATMLGRLRRGVSLEQAATDVAGVATSSLSIDPRSRQPRTAHVIPLYQQLVGDYDQILWMFMVAACCLFAVGTANVISLHIARNSARRLELSVRLALGASRLRVAQQLAVEAMLIAALSGAVGLVVGVASIRLIIRNLPQGFPRLQAVGFGPNATAVCFVTAFVLGSALAITSVIGTRTLSKGLRSELNGRGATASPAKLRLRRALIGFQIAAAITLFACTGLLMKSLMRLVWQDSGMREKNLWMVTVTIPPPSSPDKQHQVWNDILARVRSLNVVASAALLADSGPPLSGSDLTIGVRPIDVALTKGAIISASARLVTSQFFSTAGIPLLKGREFTHTDSLSSPPVVVVNELAARTLWPGANPIGQRLLFAREPATVVGLVPSFKHARLDGPLRPQLYIPYEQQPAAAPTSTLLVRARLGATGISAAIRQTLIGAYPTLSTDVATMNDVRWRVTAEQRFQVAVLGTFASITLLLVIVGVFGLVSFVVANRQREIAVRVALGASRGDVAIAIVARLLMPAVVGVSLGIGATVLAARFLSAHLFGTSSIDPSVLMCVVGAVLISLTVATVAPLQGALRRQPAVLLRQD